jgi:hypothetical protein
MSGKSFIVLLKNLKIDESTAEFLIFEQIKYLLIMTTVHWTVYMHLK